MMAPTHRVMASSWWLGGVLVANVAGAGINPLVAAAGVVVAPIFGAGHWSPDADTTWLRRFGHRRATHRADTTAIALTVISLLVAVPAIWVLPFGAGWLAFAPISGWWSHLVGDWFFGRIPLGEAAGRAALFVFGARLVRQGRDGTWWAGLGWDTDGLLERGNHRSSGRTARGLHKTRKVLPFAPATVLLSAATVVLYLLVVVQALAGRGAAS
jgi:hypothetical protein